MKLNTKTEVAQASQQIKKILKKEFPKTKFSVKSSNFTGGNSIDVSWVDGVSRKKVEKLISYFQYGKFNGQDEVYEHTNCRNDIPQTKYLCCSREISDEFYFLKLEEIRTRWDFLANIDKENIGETNQEISDKTGCWTAKQFIYQQFRGFQEIDIN
jgi:hypothetical protein